MGYLNSGKISPNKAYREMQRTQTGPDEEVETQPSTTTDYDDNGKEVIAVDITDILPLCGALTRT
jgi:hypothetical protein